VDVRWACGDESERSSKYWDGPKGTGILFRLTTFDWQLIRSSYLMGGRRTSVTISRTPDRFENDRGGDLITYFRTDHRRQSKVSGLEGYRRCPGCPATKVRPRQR
jgi:hypothetical protein